MEQTKLIGSKDLPTYQEQQGELKLRGRKTPPQTIKINGTGKLDMKLQPEVLHLCLFQSLY